MLARGNLKKIEYPEDLRRSVRVYLGMKRAGCNDLEKIGRAIGWLVSETLPVGSVARVKKLEARLAEVKDDEVIQDVRKRGLPLTALVHLENGVTIRCKRCGSVRGAVPCCNCAARWSWREEPEDEEDLPLRTPDFPTQAAPGSPEKIDLMQARLSLGQSCFHPNDRALTFGYTGISRKNDTVSL